MRERWVRIVAGVTGSLVVVLALAFAWLQNPREPPAAQAVAPAAPPPARIAAGRALYESQGCALCHAVAGEGNPRFPLDGVGGRHDAPALRDWILASGSAAERLAAGVARRKHAYRNLSREELDALVAYLQTLEAPPAPQ